MKIMEELSKILGIYVTANTLERELKILETSGGLPPRKTQEIIVMICKYLNSMEKN